MKNEYLEQITNLNKKYWSLRRKILIDSFLFKKKEVKKNMLEKGRLFNKNLNWSNNWKKRLNYEVKKKK